MSRTPTDDAASEAVAKARAYREARRCAREGTDMAVGLQLNDVTGDLEWGWCPLAVAGPAFVVDIKNVIRGRKR